MSGILFPAIVESIRTRKDNTVSIVLATQELSSQRMGELFGLMNKLTACYISPKESVTNDERDKVDKIDPILGGKSPSQRLRNTLFVLYEQDAKGFDSFDSFYKNRMEAIIEHYKSKLDPK